MSFDVRETLVREGLADDRLQGVLAAERFATTAARQANRPSAAIRAAPQAGAEQLDQLLFGERFDILETRGGFALGQAVRDGYVGWVGNSGAFGRDRHCHALGRGALDPGLCRTVDQNDGDAPDPDERAGVDRRGDRFPGARSAARLDAEKPPTANRNYTH